MRKSDPRHLLCCLLLLAAPLTPPTAAAPPPSADLVEPRRHDLEEQRAAIARLQAGMEKKRAGLQTFRTQGDAAAMAVTASMVEEARMEKEGAEIELQSIELDSQASERHQHDLAAAVELLQHKLKDLRGIGAPTSAQRAALAETERQLAEKKNLQDLEGEQQSLLEQRARSTREKLELAKDYWSLLSERYEAIQSTQREEALAELEKRLKQEADRLLSLSAQLNEKLGAVAGSGPEAEAEKSLLQTQIKEAEESGYLLKVQLQAEQSAYTLRQLESAFQGKELETPRLAAIVAEVDQVDSELKAAISLTQGKLRVLQQLLEVKQKHQPTNATAQQKLRREQQIVAALIDQFGRQLAALQRVAEQAVKVAEAVHQTYLEDVKRGLTARHQLPTELFEWKALSEEVLLLPQTLAQAALDAGRLHWAALTQASPARWSGLLGLEGVWLLLWLHIGRLPTLQAVATAKRGASFSETAMDVALALLRDNRLGLLFCGMTLLAGWGVDVDDHALALLALGWGLWFGGRLPVRVAYWLLLSPRVARADWKEHIYRINQWFVVLSVLLALFLMLGQLDIITDELSALAERAFMLFIACSFMAALRIRPRVLLWLQERVASRRWFKITSLASFLFLAFMLGASALGVAGYVNLAWAMAAHLAWVLLAVMAWYIARGVLHDLAKAAKKMALSRSTRGALWAQDIIDPLHQLARVTLAVGAAMTLFRIFGWNTASPIVLAVVQGLTYPLFKIGEQSFDAQRLLLTGLFVAAVLWMTRWIRKFSFRWLYARIADIGVRNSLAAFTQYTFFVVGVLIALKTLGLDLTSLAIFTGAVGVGIGLGLQSIANNFLSGIILLLERPLRAKDLVTVAGIEGEVKDLGIRAVTVRTADNQEVIIPNADIIGHPLINWTRSDRILRTQFTVTVSYHDDPHRAREIILAAVRAHPAVLPEPAPTVWLHEFATNGISFQAQYFVNIEESGRAEVKSQILLAQWDALKAAGMTIPAPAAAKV